MDLEGNFLKQINDHNCPSGAENIGVKRVVTSLKRRAVDTMETPAVLRANVLQNVSTPIMAQVPDKAASKKIVKRARGIEPAPAQPLDIAQLQIPHNYQVYTRTEGQEEQILLADSGIYVMDGRQQRILIFARASYSTWAHQMNELFVDGTFSLAPALFYQVYVREYQPVNQGNPNQVNPAQLYPAQPIIDFLEGIAGNYQMDQ